MTVAGIIERDGKFLLVEEETDDGIRFNQPAGHLEQGESLVDAAVREVLEETAYHFRPQFLVGVYLWPHAAKGVTYLRFAFGGEIVGFDAERKLDSGIIAARWLAADEVAELAPRHRSPLIARCIDDFCAGKRHPLELIAHYQ